MGMFVISCMTICLNLSEEIFIFSLRMLTSLTVNKQLLIKIGATEVFKKSGNEVTNLETFGGLLILWGLGDFFLNYIIQNGFKVKSNLYELDKLCDLNVDFTCKA